MQIKTKFALILLCLSFTACNEGDLAIKATGEYEGFWASTNQSGLNQLLVYGNLSQPNKKELRLELKTIDQTKIVAIFNIEIKSKSKIQISDQVLTKFNDSCFENKTYSANTADYFRLCVDDQQLTLDIFPSGKQQLPVALTLNRIVSSKRISLEPSREYSLTELIERSLDHNFLNQVEFQKVIQARENAKLASSLLVPHLSSGTLLNVAFSGWTALYRAIGDLLPFLFPSRWIAAQEASLQAQVEEVTQLIMKADSANIVEGLGYGIGRDAEVLNHLQLQVRHMEILKDEILQREKLSLLPMGSSDDIQTVINAAAKTISTFSLVTTRENAALAQASGFFNPKAISELKFDLNENPKQYEFVDEKWAREIIAMRSYELQQIDLLVEIAKQNKVERYFTWLDPSGSSQGALGVNLLPYVAIGESQIQEMLLKRENMKSLLLQKLEDTMQALRQSIEIYRLADYDAQVQVRRVNRLTSSLRLGLNFSMTDLIHALSQSFQSEVDRINAYYSFFVARAQLNRLLFLGPYSRLEPGAIRLKTLSGKINKLEESNSQ